MCLNVVMESVAEIQFLNTGIHTSVSSQDELSGGINPRSLLEYQEYLQAPKDTYSELLSFDHFEL